MSESTNGKALNPNDGERVRRRQYRITTRALKEYTARLAKIAHQLGEHLHISEGKTRTPQDVWLVMFPVLRYQGIFEQLGELTLFASQMLVHYHLDEAEAAELRVRLADAEQVVHLTGLFANTLADRYPEVFGDKIDIGKLAKIIKQAREARSQ